MRIIIRSIILTTVCFVALPVQAATYSDPSWPCIQRKVEKLSMGIMWPHPVPKKDLEALTSPAVRDLIAKLSLRRIPVEETEPLVAQFVKDSGSADVALLGQVFGKVFQRIASSRRKIIDGIARYSFKQIALSKSVDKTRDEMVLLSAAAKPDFDKIDKLEEKLDWDERIYKERARSLTYVCETPVLLEKRLFGISKILQNHVKNP